MKLKNYFNRIFKSWWFILLILGVVLRLALMPTTLHVDLWGHSFSAYFLAYEGRWNIYETLVNLPLSHPLVKNFGVADIFIYPPLTYYTLGFFKLLTRPFSDAFFIPWLMSNLDKIFNPHWLDLFVLMGMGGIYGAAFLLRFKKAAPLPSGDPWLTESIRFENT